MESKHCFERIDPKDDLGHWMRLFEASASDFLSFRGFKAQHIKLFRGDYLLLQQRHRMTRYGLFAEQGGEKVLVAAAIHFQSLRPDLGPHSALGGFLFDPKLDPQALRSFAERLKDIVSPGTIAPYNGHMNLGLSTPDPSVKASSISFLCSPSSVQTQRFFEGSLDESPPVFRKSRALHALLTPLDTELKNKTRSGLREFERRGFTSRPISVLRFKRDMVKYNALVNMAMRDHPHFYPLTFEEEWELWRSGLLVCKPSWFRFLLHRGKEIGFCLAVPDYNCALRSEYTDIRNLASIQSLRATSRFRRGRLIYSGMSPEYQGQGLFKAVRHAVIDAMAQSGAQEFESSYVDEANFASLGNVKSTGGSLSHSFYLYE